MSKRDQYFDDKNEDRVSDGWAADHRRMLAIDRNRNKIPDDLEPFMKEIETQVRWIIVTTMLVATAGLALLALLGWLLA